MVGLYSIDVFETFPWTFVYFVAYYCFMFFVMFLYCRTLYVCSLCAAFMRNKRW